jgi:hypothetical protein
MFDQGKGVTKNLVAAAQWYEKAAEGGLALAQYNIASMYELGEGVTQDYVKAVEWYQKAADQGYGKAQVSLGTLYHQGKGVPQDLVKAHLWYSLAATQLKDGRHKDRAVKNRETVLKHMKPAQIVEAQQMANAWQTKGK